MTYSPHSGHEPDQWTLLIPKPITRGYYDTDLGLQRPKFESIIYGLDIGSLIYGIRIKGPNKLGYAEG